MANGLRHPRRAIEPSAFDISLSKGNGRPLFMQLHEQIIARISAGELTAGARLPPVRRLAEPNEDARKAAKFQLRAAHLRDYATQALVFR